MTPSGENRLHSRRYVRCRWIWVRVGLTNTNSQDQHTDKRYIGLMSPSLKRVDGQVDLVTQFQPKRSNGTAFEFDDKLRRPSA